MQIASAVRRRRPVQAVRPGCRRFSTLQGRPHSEFNLHRYGLLRLRVLTPSLDYRSRLFSQQP